jgi:two-component system response regulator VicR
VLRRVYGAGAGEVLRLGAAEVHWGTGTVRRPGGGEAALTAKEYDLVELLMKNPRRVYSRESLMDLVWGYSYAGDYRTVDVHIRRLREKLERVPAEPAYIITKWGVGYYFAGEDQPTI